MKRARVFEKSDALTFFRDIFILLNERSDKYEKDLY